MKFAFVNIVNNKLIYKTNNVKINEAFQSGKITEIQTKLLLSNNNKWQETCNHKGLLGNNYKLTRPRTLEQLKANKESFYEKTIEFYKFNDLCNIGSLKWVLGNAMNNNIKAQNVEDRIDIVSRLVGSNEDLEYFKEWVANTDLDEFDISLYFDLDKTIDELFSSNIINNIKDE